MAYADTISNLAFGAIQSDAFIVSPNTQYDLYAWVRGELDPNDSAHTWQIRALYYDANNAYINYQDAYGGAPETVNTTW
jgi:hypothetical protein